MRQCSWGVVIHSWEQWTLSNFWKPSLKLILISVALILFSSPSILVFWCTSIKSSNWSGWIARLVEPHWIRGTSFRTRQTSWTTGKYNASQGRWNRVCRVCSCTPTILLLSLSRTSSWKKNWINVCINLHTQCSVASAGSVVHPIVVAEPDWLFGIMIIIEEL